MERSYQYESLRTKDYVEYNSEDTNNHPFGDFFIGYIRGVSVPFKIDESRFSISINKDWCFFHRDPEGKIDHIFITDTPYDHSNNCELCREMKWKQEGMSITAIR